MRIHCQFASRLILSRCVPTRCLSIPTLLHVLMRRAIGSMVTAPRDSVPKSRRGRVAVPDVGEEGTNRAQTVMLCFFFSLISFSPFSLRFASLTCFENHTLQCTTPGGDNYALHPHICDIFLFFLARWRLPRPFFSPSSLFHGTPIDSS